MILLLLKPLSGLPRRSRAGQREGFFNEGYGVGHGSPIAATQGDIEREPGRRLERQQWTAAGTAVFIVTLSDGTVLPIGTYVLDCYAISAHLNSFLFYRCINSCTIPLRGILH